MTAATAPSKLDLSSDLAVLTAALVDMPSESGAEAALADAVTERLAALPHLRLDRDGATIVARTRFGRDRRILLAGHLDTVPIAGNLPSRRNGDLLYGCGTSDMKSGVAVLLQLAATLTVPRYDLTYVCYDCEEIDAARNGLGRVVRDHRDWLTADLAVLLEPTDGKIEAGCQGTLRARVDIAGRRAHSARSWLGDNAVHKAGAVLRRLEKYQARTVEIDGCSYREGLNAVAITGGVAGNVIPDACAVTVNYRFAPDRTERAAFDHVQQLFPTCEVTLLDSAPAALPGLAAPAAQDFLRAVGSQPLAKLGWTDVARFAELGIPAVNFGPGDPNLAHTQDEHVDVRRIQSTSDALRRYLDGP